MDYLPNPQGGTVNPEPAHGLKFTQALDQMHEELGAVLARLTPDMAETLIQELEAAPRIFGCAAGRSGIYPPGLPDAPDAPGLHRLFGGGDHHPPPPPRRPAHGHVGLRRDGPAPGDAAPGQRRGRPHPGPDRPPGIHHRPGGPGIISIPGTTKLTLNQEADSVQCPGSLFEQACFLFLEAWCSSSTSDAWATTRAKSWTATRMWSKQ